VEGQTLGAVGSIGVVSAVDTVTTTAGGAVQFGVKVTAVGQSVAFALVAFSWFITASTSPWSVVVQGQAFIAVRSVGVVLAFAHKY